jgi:pimeloyl-ACP methyl ester carboxylesterase
MTIESRATAQIGTPLFFPAGDETLFGILTEPGTNAVGAASILVQGGGQGPSAGRNQTSARLCRRLAEEGYHALRFDYRGVGDSTGIVERFRLDQPFTEDLDAAIHCLRDRGIERFVLIGGCFGARTALACAPTVPGLEAIVLLSSLPVRDKEKDEVGTIPLMPDRTLWGYVRRIVRPHVIRGLLRGDQRRTYARVAQAAWRTRSTRRELERQNTGPHWVSTGLVTSLEAVLRRGIPVLILCGTADPGFKDFERALSGRLGEILRRAESLVDIEVLQGRVASFADASLHNSVIDLTAAWLVRRRG